MKRPPGVVTKAVVLTRRHGADTGAQEAPEGRHAPQGQAAVADAGETRPPRLVVLDPRRPDVVDAEIEEALEAGVQDERVGLVDEHVLVAVEAGVEVVVQHQMVVGVEVAERCGGETRLPVPVPLEPKRVRHEEALVRAGQVVLEVAQRQLLVAAESGAVDGDHDAHRVVSHRRVGPLIRDGRRTP